MSLQFPRLASAHPQGQHGPAPALHQVPHGCPCLGSGGATYPVSIALVPHPHMDFPPPCPLPALCGAALPAPRRLAAHRPQHVLTANFIRCLISAALVEFVFGTPAERVKAAYRTRRCDSPYEIWSLSGELVNPPIQQPSSPQAEGRSVGVVHSWIDWESALLGYLHISINSPTVFVLCGLTSSQALTTEAFISTRGPKRWLPY